nr:PREDICTED: ATP-dependent DNA helicase pfh1-like [Megachile rotundata]
MRFSAQSTVFAKRIYEFFGQFDDLRKRIYAALVRKGLTSAAEQFTHHSSFRFKLRNLLIFGVNPKKKFESMINPVRVLIMDEYSVARPALLAMINDRLQSAKGNRFLFGGVFVYLVGDIFQLPPVLAPAFFSKMNGNTNSLDVRGREIFRSEFKKVFILTSNHRQVGSSQSAFRNMLTNLSRGEDLESIVNFLNQRVRKGTDNTENHTIISHTKELVKQTNYTKLEQTRMPVALIEAKNVPRDAEAADCGFPNILQISVGSKVILIYNLSVRHGLANGSQGIVKDIIYI